MSTVSAVFASMSSAENALAQLKQLGVKTARVNVLAHGDHVPVKSEHRGMGAETFLVPGLGPIVGVGVLAAGLAGAGFGAAGKAAESHTAGVPNEDLYFYEEALRRGHVVVLVESSDSDEAVRVRNVLEHAGGMNIDRMRRDWWGAVRDYERDHARSRGVDFEPNEGNYRAGFEAALHPATRGRGFDECVAYIETCYPEPCKSDAFRIAFSRGQQYLVSRSGSAQVM